MAKPTEFMLRFLRALEGGQLTRYDLAQALYPPKPSADGSGAWKRDPWNYSSNGGPPGCMMAVSAAISRYEKVGLVWVEWTGEPGPGDRRIGLLEAGRRLLAEGT